MHVSFVCTACKSHCGVHLGPLQTNKSLPSDKLIKVPSCCCAWLTDDSAGAAWDSFPWCIVYPAFFSQRSRPEVADWVLSSSDCCSATSHPKPDHQVTCSLRRYLSTFLPKHLGEWILTSLTPVCVYCCPRKLKYTLLWTCWCLMEKDNANILCTLYETKSWVGGSWEVSRSKLDWQRNGLILVHWKKQYIEMCCWWLGGQVHEWESDTAALLPGRYHTNSGSKQQLLCPKYFELTSKQHFRLCVI